MYAESFQNLFGGCPEPCGKPQRIVCVKDIEWLEFIFRQFGWYHGFMLRPILWGEAFLFLNE